MNTKKVAEFSIIFAFFDPFFSNYAILTVFTVVRNVGTTRLTKCGCAFICDKKVFNNLVWECLLVPLAIPYIKRSFTSNIFNLLYQQKCQKHLH